VGGRFDLAHSIYRDRFSNEVLTDKTNFAFSPRAGIVYQPIEPVSLYFSYATAFDPSLFGVSATGAGFQPERGRQFEVGVKTNWLDNRLSTTLAAYQINRTNVLVTDPDNPNFNLQTGEQTSRGVEFNLVGTPINGWNLSLSYAYTNAFVREDTNPEFVGDRLVNAPEHQAGLWSNYEIQNGNLAGLGFGLGLYYVSEREANLPNSGVRLPSYFRVDAGAFYRRGNWRVQLNVKNLTNIDYYTTQGFFMVPQPPLTVLESVSFEF
jgi:iron complex outermembrane recepter protein